MKIKFLTIIAMLAFVFQGKAQNNPDFNGFKLKQTANTNVKVYQSVSGRLDISKFKFWNFKYYFYVIKEVKIETDEIPAVAAVIASPGPPAVLASPAIAKIPATSTTYVKIFIPDDDENVKDATNVWTDEFTGFIDKDDFNTFLYIEKTDFDQMKTDHFEKYSHGFVVSGLAVPFKIYPKTGDHATSLSNSSFSVGTFLGYRLGYLGLGGLSVGPTFGIASINQNAANNTSILGTDSESMFAANYGIAVVVDISSKFQIGGVVGWDYGYGDKSTTYIYQNKNWFALSFNFNFLDFGKKSADQ